MWCSLTLQFTFDPICKFSQFLGVPLTLMNVLSCNTCNSLTRLPWQCCIVTQAVQHLHINGASGGGIWGEAVQHSVISRELTFAFTSVQIQNPRAIFSILPATCFFLLKDNKHKFSTCQIIKFFSNNQNIDHIWLATVMCHPHMVESWFEWGVVQVWFGPDRNLVRWRFRVQPEHWQAVWHSAGHHSQFPRWPSGSLQAASWENRNDWCVLCFTFFKIATHFQFEMSYCISK